MVVRGSLPLQGQLDGSVGIGRVYDGASDFRQTNFRLWGGKNSGENVDPAGHAAGADAFRHVSSASASPSNNLYPLGHSFLAVPAGDTHQFDPAYVSKDPDGHCWVFVSESFTQRGPVGVIVVRVPAGHTSVYQPLIVLTQHLRPAPRSGSRVAGRPRRCDESLRGYPQAWHRSTWPSCPANQSKAVVPPAWSHCTA
jgi:hypothetical protein